MSNDPVFTEDLSQLISNAGKTPKPAFSGAWCSVELQPDVFVPQRFTVGVIVQPLQDRLYFKLIDDFKRFECLYDDRLPPRELRELMAYAEETLRLASQKRISIPEVVFETTSLRLSTPHFTSGDDREETVERLFSEIVVMAYPQKKVKRDFESLDTNQVRALVNDELKRIAKLDFDLIVNQGTYGILVEEEGIKHFLDLNLVTARACGSVTSAVYKTPQTVELNLLKSSRDLTTYSRIRQLDNIGLFLLMPDEGAMGQKEYERIEHVIADYEWKLEQDGFRVVSMPSPANLAFEIYEWAKPTF